MRHVNSMLNRPALLGHTRAGAPIWSMAGGSDDDGGGDSDDGGDGDDGDGDGDGDGEEDGEEDDKPLGKAGQKALEAMKKRARAAERENRRLNAEAARRKGTGDDDGDGDDDEADAKKIREQVESEVRAEASRERALDKLEVAASKAVKDGRPAFSNPELARKLLSDRADEFLDDKGKPDVEAINEALDELLDEEPYLAAQGSKWQGSGDGGPRKPKAPEVKPGLSRLRHAYAESSSKK